MKLWAISDLHIGYEENRRAVQALPAHPDDWLIIAGDTGESPDASGFRAAHAAPAFRATDLDTGQSRSVDAHHLAERATRRGALRAAGRVVPEVRRAHPGRSVCALAGRRSRRAPSSRRFSCSTTRFVPRSVPRERAIEWAAESGVRSADEDLLAPDPYATRDEWCHARVDGHRGAAGSQCLQTSASSLRIIFPSARSRRAATHSTFLDLVWHDQDRRLASPLQRRSRRLRSSAPASVSRARRRAL